MKNIENKEKIKYSIKNNKSEDRIVFLEIINQIKTKTNSKINFRLLETKRCIV